MKSFKEWLKVNEVGTSTASVAVFARPVFSSPISRFPLKKKKKKTKISL